MRLYGVSFEKLIEQRILRPLGMRSTGFVVPHAEQTHLVQGYSRSAKPMPYHLRNAGAAYGLYSTTRDMAKYVHWQPEESDPVIRLAHQPLQGNVENGEALCRLVRSARAQVPSGGGPLMEWSFCYLQQSRNTDVCKLSRLCLQAPTPS